MQMISFSIKLKRETKKVLFKKREKKPVERWAQWMETSFSS